MVYVFRRGDCKISIFFSKIYKPFNIQFKRRTCSSLCQDTIFLQKGAQWFSGRVLDSRLKGRGFEPHRPHCVVVLEQDTFTLA